ncbi:flagellar biosynthetic protein FliO [Desulfohalovibrio reitneri]|uniref:flagellar biosynthetic protein FliO n=1 Tax=Desulfohalovibrio reitneri TaxID=1307759 RepID=UPI001F01DC29|nr:flagellar biosynthetic protein FliO [Desulfohalovibrio reitneri]
MASPVHAAQAAATAAAQTQPGGVPDPTGSMFTVIASLLLLLAVLFAGFWLLRKFGHKAGLNLGGGSGKGGLKLVAQMPLGPKRSVVVVRFLNREMVLGVTEHSINLLTELEHDNGETDFAQTLAGQSRKASS